MNTFGNTFRFTSFGESHGVAMGGVIDGCPAGLVIDYALIDRDLARRRGADGTLTTARCEADKIEWLSGIKDGIALGTPISFIIRNGDVHSEDYDALSDCYRAGHADYTYQKRYGIRDHRGGGRASGRETVARVVAGAIAKMVLAQHSVSVSATVQMLPLSEMDADETYGGRVECVVTGLPAGVGNPIFGRLNAMLAYAMMSIPSAIGFEMGIGSKAMAMTGREYADAWHFDDAGNAVKEQITETNHCGGVQGGISNGMPVVFSVMFHPVVTQMGENCCLGADGKARDVVIGGRHDRCHVMRLPVVVEAMAALVVADLLCGRPTVCFEEEK